jgi:hypothetical protein
MAREIYTEKGRKLRTLSEDGKRGSVEIGRKILDKKTGQLMSEIDFSRVDMDVDVSVGPTSASRRAAVVRTLVALKGATSDPEMAMMMDHMALMNLEGEGLQDLRDYSRKRMVALGVIKPTKEEEEELAASQEPQPPDPQALLAQALTMESEAKAMKAKADAILAAARTEETQAKTAETLAGIPLAQQKQALETARAIADDMKPQEPMNAGPV